MITRLESIDFQDNISFPGVSGQNKLGTCKRLEAKAKPPVGRPKQPRFTLWLWERGELDSLFVCLLRDNAGVYFLPMGCTSQFSSQALMITFLAELRAKEQAKRVTAEKVSKKIAKKASKKVAA